VESDLATRLLELVKQLRQERALSQEEYAERAGLDPKHYQHVEARRKTDFRMSTLEKLARGFGLAPWELLQLVEESPVLGEERQAKYRRTAKKRPDKK
jgi:transcriptional regulator with XRE-family HTH domain